ncbi:MAG TPA: hypothetical protein VG272_00570 [Candidatus Acidoferrales bacterium]|nr:hypothetical protein [Candidatus Acidoferrales bacterium]
MLALEVVTVFLAAIAMSMALAHALEYPGKRRLDAETYMAVQTIYYPGFTLGGIGEPLAAISTLLLLIAVRDRGVVFWLILGALFALVAMHLVFWFVTQPTNKFWLRNQQLSGAGARFFNVDRSEAGSTEVDRANPAMLREKVNPEWKRFRDRWEYSHVIRAALSAMALIALIIAVAM